MENKGIETAGDYKINEGEFYDERDCDNLIDDYNKLIDREPNDAGVYFHRGTLYFSKEKYDKAIEDFNKAIDIDSNYVKAYHYRGNTYYLKGEYYKAIKDYNNAIDIKSDYDEAYYDRGNVYSDKMEYDKAIEDYSKAIDIKSDYDEAYYSRGNIYFKKMEYDKAIEDYSKAIEIKPDSVDGYYCRGNAYYKNDEYDKAIEDYNKVIDIRPNTLQAYNNRGNAYSLKGEYDKAIEDYSKAIEIKSDYITAYNNRGYIYYCIKEDHEKAIKDYSKAIKINSDVDIAYTLYSSRADAYEAIGKHNQAKMDRNKAKPLKVKLDDEQFYYYIQSMKFNNKIESNIWELFLAISKLKQSFLNISYTAKVAHYTKLSTLKFLINRDEEQPRLRLNNVSYMNDPSEGTVFLKLLKQVDEDVAVLVDKLYGTDNIGSRQKFVGRDTFLVSFSKNIDTSLPMWTQYTDDGQGACLIFNQSFFDYKDESSSIAVKQQEESIKKNDCKECYCLYDVNYIKWNDGKQKYNIIPKLKELIEPICKQLIKLNAMTGNSKNKEKLNEIIQNLLDQVRFLYKDDIYEYEAEQRIIKLESDPNKVKITGDAEGFVVPHTYIEIDKPLMIDEVILGPKVKNPTEAANYIYFVNRNISVSKSRIQYQ